MIVLITPCSCYCCFLLLTLTVKFTRKNFEECDYKSFYISYMMLFALVETTFLVPGAK